MKKAQYGILVAMFLVNSVAELSVADLCPAVVSWINEWY